MLWLPEFGAESRRCAGAVFGRYIAAARASITPGPAERGPLEDAARRLYAAVGAPEPEMVWVASPRRLLAVQREFASPEQELASWPFSPENPGFAAEESWVPEDGALSWSTACWLASAGYAHGALASTLNMAEVRRASAVNHVLESTLVRAAAVKAGRRFRMWAREELDGPVPSRPEAASSDVRRVLARVYRWDRRDAGLLLDWMASSGITTRSPAIGAMLELTYSGLWWLPVSGAVLFCDRPTSVLLPDDPDLSGGNVRIRYADGWGMSVVDGVSVPRWLDDTPADQLDPRRFARIQNVEAQRIFVRKVGMDRLLAAHKAKTLDRWGSYELYRLKLGRLPGMVFLRMTNPSTGEIHVEGVSPRCRTVKAALAWRDGESTYIEPEVIT